MTFREYNKWSAIKFSGCQTYDQNGRDVPAINDFPSANLNSKSFLMGVDHEPEPCPRNGSRRVTRDEYASDFYPVFAERHSIIYSPDIASKLNSLSHLVNFFLGQRHFCNGISRVTNVYWHHIITESFADGRKFGWQAKGFMNLTHPNWRKNSTMSHCGFWSVRKYDHKISWFWWFSE